jgi:hypothetical protein
MRRVGRTLWILLAVIALTSAPLRAQAESSDGSSDGHWYGWQTLIITGASVTLTPFTLMTAGVSGAVGVGGLVFGGPIVHFAHGNVGRGFTAFGLNLGGAVVGGAIGAGVGFAASDQGVRDSELWIIYGGLVGGLVGITATNIIDAAVLAYDSRGSAGSGMTSRPRKAATFLPTVDIGPGRASLGVMGTF